jgi:ribosomal protein S13
MNTEHVKLFEDLMSGNKEAMTRAEAKILELKAAGLNAGGPVFIAGMQSEKGVVAQLATLMLKKTYLDDPEVVKNLTNEQILSLKETLKQFVVFEGKDWKTLQRLADALAKVYAITDLQTSFADILSWFKSSNALAKQFSVYLIEVLCELGVLKDDVVKSSSGDFKAIFEEALQESQGIQVVLTSVQAVTQFLNNLKENETVLLFTPLAERILNSMIAVLKVDRDMGKSALGAINNLTESHPKFWKENLEVLIHYMCEIGREATFSNEIRESAIEIIYTIAKKSPAFLRKSKNFANIFMPLVFSLLLDLDNVNNIDAWNKVTEEDEKDLELMFYGARDGISRLSIDLGAKFFAETTTPYIKKFLASENWIENHAAFMIIGYMAQGCAEIFKTNVVDLLNYISQGLVHAHPRVIYAALTALGLLLEEIAPVIQKKFHSNIIPALCKLMSLADSPNLPIKVRTQACSALVNFLRGMIHKDAKDDDHEEATKIIMPHAAVLLQMISALFENSLTLNYAPLQEETLTALSLMATLMDKDFADYYPSIMPGLKQIFYNLQPVTIQQANLKSNAIETISYLCSSISENSEKFTDDLKELSESFAKLLSTLKEEDPQVPALLTAFSHISTSMRENFYPYLDFILPLLETYIKADIGFKLEDADIKEYVPEDSASKEDKKLSVMINMQGVENKKLSMNSFALQNKIMALNVLHEICLNMGESFNPFLERMLVLTKELLKFPYSRKIRKLSIKSLFAGILTCKDDEQKKQVFDFISKDVISVLEYNIKSKLLREIKTYLKILIHTCEEIKNKNVYSEEFIVRLFQSMEEIVKFVEEHKVKVKDYVKNDEGLDEEDDDTLASDINILNETSRRVMELSGIVFKLFRGDLNDLVNRHLFDQFFNMWTIGVSKTKNDQEILNAVCFFDDYLNYATEENCLKFYPKFLELAVDNFKTKNEDIIQSIVYGLGVIAERLSKEEFSKVQGKVLGYIVNILKRNVNDDNSGTFDNAIGALGKYVYKQSNNDAEGIALASEFIALLPLKNDFDEGEAVLRLFFENLLNQHPLLVNDSVLPKVKEAIQRIIEFRKEEEILDEEGLALFIQVCLVFGITA